ncbi:MAG: transposase [Elusimicrobia bacterium RIFCSPLOWO2_12_FULL_59_9]|nr:MAG: transposase [Elusimicrobia bacterium RIFCSPLOWO2_12_FULL_59_9]
MSKSYQPYEPDQMMLMPPSLKEWLPAGHLAHFVSDVVDSLDLSAITLVYEREERGYPPYHPAMMTKVLVYGYCIGVASSRRIERACVEDIAFRVLAANNTPDFCTISDFRKRHLKALRRLFVEVLRLCQEAGLVKLGHVALDGTKMRANASKHKAMSYGRMLEEEKRLEAEVDRLLKEAEETDSREDALYGPGRRGDELPEELARRESRLQKIREAKEALERKAREAAEERKKEIAAREAEGPKPGRKPQDPDPTPDPKAQRNFTDPDSRIMPSSTDKGSFLQGYNCQAAVDGEHQIIVAAEVTQQTNDSGQAVPMLEQVVANTGALPERASMDAGYFSGGTVEAVADLGCEPFIPPDKPKHGQPPPPVPRGRIPQGLSVADRMRRKLRTKRGRAVYARRKEIVEPVFGQIKQSRGFRQFLLRGLEKVRGEWALICTGHNLLKLWKAVATGPPRVRYAFS